jgi:hypothetical protein
MHLNPYMDILIYACGFMSAILLIIVVGEWIKCK